MVLTDGKFLEAETRSGFFVDTVMKKVWAKDLEMLSIVDEICTRHNITWFADGGTLLGAVRHKGFIPWDDDIDIQMMRSDYDKFISICQSELPVGFVMQWTGSEKNFQPWHAKLRDDRTTGTTKFETECFPEWHRGIFIDIFPLDNVPDGKVRCIFHTARLKFLQLILLSNETRRAPSAKKITKALSKALWCVLERFTTHEKLAMNYLKVVKSVKNGTKKVGVTAFKPGCKKYEWRRALFEKTIELPFENVFVTAPENFDERLKVQYGADYMVFKKGGEQHTKVYFDPDNAVR